MPYSICFKQFWHICPSVCESKRLAWNYLPWREEKHKTRKERERFSLQQLSCYQNTEYTVLRTSCQAEQCCSHVEVSPIVCHVWLQANNNALMMRERRKKTTKPTSICMPAIKIFNAWKETWSKAAKKPSSFSESVTRVLFRFLRQQTGSFHEKCNYRLLTCKLTWSFHHISLTSYLISIGIIKLIEIIFLMPPK